MEYELKELLAKWKEKHRCDEKWKDNFPMRCQDKKIPDEFPFKNNFIEDGCFYEGQKIKILFIARESNIEAEINDNKQATGFFWMKNVARVKDENEKAYYIPSDVKKIERNDKRMQTVYYQYLKKIKSYILGIDSDNLCECAYMNLNKRGGYSRCYFEKGHFIRLERYIEDYKSFIKKEIEILNPEYIVFLGGGSYTENIMNLFPEKKENIYVLYHPSGRNLEKKLKQTFHSQYKSRNPLV